MSPKVIVRLIFASLFIWVLVILLIPAVVRADTRISNMPAMACTTADLFMGQESDEIIWNKITASNLATCLSGLSVAASSSDTEVLINSGGVLTGDPNLTFDGSAVDINSSGTRNLFINGGNKTATSFDNVIVGPSAGESNTSGLQNVFLGKDAGRNNTEGNQNVFVGYEAGEANVDTSGNVFVGQESGTLNTGAENIMIGKGSGDISTTADNNIFIGAFAGDLTTTGDSNIVIGSGADTPGATESSRLNIGNTIYGNLANDAIGIGVVPVDGTKLTLPTEDDNVTPTFAFGDGDTGVSEPVDDTLRFTTGTVEVLNLTLTGGEYTRAMNFNATTLTALGADLVTNGAFGADTDWTKGDGWTVGGGNASSDGTQSAASDLLQAITLTNGSTYQVVFTMSGFSAGVARPVLAGTNGTLRSSDATFTEYIVAGADNDFTIEAGTTFVGNVDDITVKLTNVSWDLALNQVTTLTLDGNLIIDNPTNQVAGAAYILHLDQDGTGSRTVTWGSVFEWSGGTAPILTTDASATDIVTFISDGTNLRGSFVGDFK